VTRGWIPKFNEAPAVMIWGTRIFKHWRTGGYIGDRVLTYRECFACALVDETKW
jgi:hypothetical protein